MVDSEALPPEPPPMADPGGVPMPSAPPQPVNIEALARATAPSPYTAPVPTPGVDIDRLAREAAEVQRDKMAATAKVNAEHESLLSRDRQRMEEQYKLAGIGPDDMKPWDAEKAREKYEYDPIQAFGSLGSIFALAASAFTNRPMENAMMGAASAMNAVKENDALAHDRAYKAWQDNTKLALDRQKIQSQQFTNAATLFNTDMKLGEERARMVAAQYGDKQMALLLDNGLYKEAIDLNEKRQQTAIRLAEAMPKLAVDNERSQDLLNRTAGMKQGSPEYIRAVQAWQQDWNGRKYDEDADFSRKWWQENPNGTSEQFSKAYGEWVKETSKLATAGSTRQPKPEEEAVRSLAAQIKAEAIKNGTPISDGDALVQATKQYRLSTAAPTGNRLDDMDQTINQMDNAKSAAQKNIEFLDSHIGGAGAAGKATRLAERVGNIFGSNETARVEFEKRLNYMKMVAPRLITMSSGRPLASEAERVNSVIAGLGWGDTTANTLAAMKAFDELMVKMQADVVARRRGTPNQPGQTTPPPAAGQPAWKSAPIVQ